MGTDPADGLKNKKLVGTGPADGLKNKGLAGSVPAKSLTQYILVPAKSPTTVGGALAVNLVKRRLSWSFPYYSNVTRNATE